METRCPVVETRGCVVLTSVFHLSCSLNPDFQLNCRIGRIELGYCFKCNCTYLYWSLPYPFQWAQVGVVGRSTSVAWQSSSRVAPPGAPSSWAPRSSVTCSMEGYFARTGSCCLPFCCLLVPGKWPPPGWPQFKWACVCVQVRLQGCWSAGRPATNLMLVVRRSTSKVRTLQTLSSLAAVTTNLCYYSRFSVCLFWVWESFA